MEDMPTVERVARALYKRSPLSGSTPLPNDKIGLHSIDWEDAPLHEQGRFRRHAMVAIAAMRDPDDEMIEAGASKFRAIGLQSREAVSEAWTTMIDKLLDDGIEP